MITLDRATIIFICDLGHSNKKNREMVSTFVRTTRRIEKHLVRLPRRSRTFFKNKLQLVSPTHQCKIKTSVQFVNDFTSYTAHSFFEVRHNPIVSFPILCRFAEKMNEIMIKTRLKLYCEAMI